jgi:hypothetical protein
VTPVEVGLCTAIFSENLSNVLEHQGDRAGAEADLRKRWKRAHQCFQQTIR